MKPEELKEYLSMVVDMEKNIFMQNQMMSQWEQEIVGLGRVREFQVPSRPKMNPLPERVIVSEKPDPPPPTPPTQPKIMRQRKFIFWIVVSAITVWGCVETISSGIPGIMIVAPFDGAICGAIVLGIMRFADMLTSNGYGEIKREYKNQKKQYVAAVEAYPSVLERHQRRQRQIEQERQQQAEQANQAAMREYQEKFDAYQSNVLKDQQRVRLENIKKDVLQAELSQMRELNAKSKEALKEIYDKNIIFPKYRTMVMVCSLYEYVCTGRCDTLEGHEGAYNLLELEIRLDKIVTQLDRVISMLGRIQQSQYMVYSAIQDANRQSAKILESTYQMADQLQALQTSNQKMLGDIQADMQKGILAAERQSVFMTQMTQQLSALQATSALTAYQSERTQKELHYMNRINYLSGKNDDVFFNLPPM